jgi:hypothetical protein
MNSGRSLEEIKRLFNYLEENKTNDNLQIIMTTEACHELYKLFIDFNKYQELLKSRINKAIEYINENVAVCAFGNKELPHWEFNDNNIFELLNILKGE